MIVESWVAEFDRECCGIALKGRPCDVGTSARSCTDEWVDSQGRGEERDESSKNTEKGKGVSSILMCNRNKKDRDKKNLNTYAS